MFGAISYSQRRIHSQGDTQKQVTAGFSLGFFAWLVALLRLNFSDQILLDGRIE